MRRVAAAMVLVAGAIVVWLLVRGGDEARFVATLPPAPTTSPAPSPPPAPVTPRPRRHAETVTPPASDEAPASSDVANSAVYRGRVVFEDGRPGVGARVRAFRAFVSDGESDGGSTATVDADGRFQLPGGSGRYAYAVLDGFAPAAGELNPSKETTLTLFRGGVVSGTLSDADDRPLPDAPLRLVRCDPRGRTRTSIGASLWSLPTASAFYSPKTKTDRDGRFRFDGAPVMPRDAKRMLCSVAVFDDADGKAWRSDVARFETSGGELVRDVHVGRVAFDSDELDPLGMVAGRVVDADDAPVGGASVRLVALADDMGEDVRDWTADRYGSFEISMGERFHADGRTMELRVGALGYRPWRGPRAGEVMRVGLEKSDATPRPGVVRGKATASDDKPLAGVLTIDFENESLGRRRTRVRADATGAFSVDGVWPGTWTVSLDRDDAKVVLGDGGEAFVALHAAHDAAWFATPPWTPEQEMNLQAMKSGLVRLEAAERRGVTDDAKETETTRVAVALLEHDRRDAAPTRDVVLRGLPIDGPSVVRAECADLTWRAAVRDGEARFAELAVDRWTFVVERPCRREAECEADVVAGDGPQTAVFTPR